MEDKAISEALGVEHAFGYHIERIRRPPLIGLVRERPPAPWYPCIDDAETYTGCLGTACPLEVCWTGTPTISYAAALRRRFQPIGIEYVPGARCVHCRHVQETSVAVIHQQRGLIHLPLLQCKQGRWVHPISAAAFVRRRIPAQEHTDPATCPEFAPAAQPIPAVEDHRLRVNRQAHTRRATGE